MYEFGSVGDEAKQVVAIVAEVGPSPLVAVPVDNTPVVADVVFVGVDAGSCVVVDVAAVEPAEGEAHEQPNAVVALDGWVEAVRVGALAEADVECTLDQLVVDAVETGGVP